MPFQPRAAALVLLALPPVLAAQKDGAPDLAWPGFRGPAHDGVGTAATPPEKWSATDNLAWKLALPGPGSSSPIIAGDRVWVTCYSGYGAYLDDGGEPKDLVHHLVCVDRANGKLIWEKKVPGPLARPARQVQISEHGFASPTPITDGEAIYCYFGRAGVVAFDLDGELLWQTDLGQPTEGAAAATNSIIREGKAIPLRWGAAASPLLHRNLVIVNCSEESNSIRALDKRTGELVWKRESTNLEGAATTPVVVGPPDEPVLVVVLGGEVWGLEPETGELLWSVETGTSGGMSPTPVADAQLVYALGGDGQGYALWFARAAGERAVAEKPTEEHPAEAAEPSADAPAKAGAARVAWKGENADIPSPVLHQGRLFAVRTDGTAVCLDAENGNVLFQGRLEGRTSSVYASPVLADGKLYVQSRKRGTFVYSADEKLALLARNELDDDSQFNASPALAGNELYLRSDRFLYRFDRAKSEPK